MAHISGPEAGGGKQGNEFMSLQIDLHKEAIADFCRRWRVAELSIFGSALREDSHDMLIAAREACEFSADLSWDEFRNSSLHQHAIAKALENIGRSCSAHLSC